MRYFSKFGQNSNSLVPRVNKNSKSGKFIILTLAQNKINFAQPRNVKKENL